MPSLPRSSALVFSLGLLVAGAAMGAYLARVGPVVSAQVAREERPAGALAPGATAVSAPRPGTASAPATATALPHPLVQARDDAVYEVLARQYERFQQVDRTFELVAKAVSPSVVHIVAQKALRGEDGRSLRRLEETGSGVIVRSDHVPGLYILTNHHVVHHVKPARTRIILKDGSTVRPVRIWSDEEADIAVLKLDRDDLPAARLGNSDDALVGSWVMALGSPFGLMQSVSQGIISARGRHMDELEDVKNQDFLQTDAAINPGNSGGPLVNMKGEVIGINNSIASNGGGNEGVGFSIPINLARWIMNELIEHDGRVTRGALGVVLQTEFRPEDATALGMDHPHGAWIRQVNPASPASEAGLRDGDVVLRFSGTEVADLNQLINLVSMAPIGRPAEVVIWRDRREIRFRVRVADRDRTFPQILNGPSDEAAPSGPAGLVRRPTHPDSASRFAIGLELATLTPQLARGMELPESWRGALVLHVESDSPLAARVRPRDVISAIDNHAVQSADQAVKALNQKADHVTSVIGLDRFTQGATEHFEVRLP